MTNRRSLIMTCSLLSSAVVQTLADPPSPGERAKPPAKSVLVEQQVPRGSPCDRCPLCTARVRQIVAQKAFADREAARAMALAGPGANLRQSPRPFVVGQPRPANFTQVVHWSFIAPPGIRPRSKMPGAASVRGGVCQGVPPGMIESWSRTARPKSGTAKARGPAAKGTAIEGPDPEGPVDPVLPPCP